jgi:hypothetical protein
MGERIRAFQGHSLTFVCRSVRFHWCPVLPSVRFDAFSWGGGGDCSSCLPLTARPLISKSPVDEAGVRRVNACVAYLGTEVALIYLVKYDPFLMRTEWTSGVDEE